MRFDVISFGSAIVDVFIKSPDIQVEKSTKVYTGKALIVPYGAKCEVEKLVVCSGGGGTNTAVGFSRLGLKAAVVARCGWDFAGKLIRQEIKKEGVDDTLLAQVEGEKTDYSTILIGPDGGRTIFVYRGGTRLEKSVIDFKKLNSSWFYVSSLEGNIALLTDLVNHAKKKQIKIAVNPGRRELEQKEKLLDLAKKFDVLTVNREEAAKLLGLTIADETIFSKICLVLPKVIVVVTDGDRGAHVCVPKKGRLVTEGLKVTKADSTGAGDGFGCGLIAGLIEGWDLEKALKLGVCNGASAVTRIGAKPGLIRKKEVDSWLEKPLKIRWEE